MRFSETLAALALWLVASAPAAAGRANRPVITVTAANTVITQSCRVVIPPGTVIRDADGKGVIRIGAPNIEIEFAEGSVLRGSPAGHSPRRVQGLRHSPERAGGRDHPRRADQRVLVRPLGDEGRRPDRSTASTPRTTGGPT